MDATPQLAAVLGATAGTCRPVGAERVSPCAPLVLLDDGTDHLDVLVAGAPVESLVVAAGGLIVDAEQVEPGRWRVPVQAFGPGPVEVRAQARVADGRLVTSDVAVVAVVP